MTKIYSIGPSGMERVDVQDNKDPKNNLPIGQILHLNGYSDPDFVVVKNLGIPDFTAGYGAQYLCVNLDNYTQTTKNAYLLEYLADKKDNRIQAYITNQILSQDKVSEIWEISEEKRKKSEAIKAQKDAERKKLERKGSEFLNNRPAWAKSAIVAEYVVDDCDSMTDYFATKHKKTLILAWSRHTRDLFPELRRAAGNAEETKHLAVAPDVDANGEKRTENNKTWWRPADEHREKYSFGNGYYLKSGCRYSTGWEVRKVTYGLNSLAVVAGNPANIKIPADAKN